MSLWNSRILDDCWRDVIPTRTLSAIMHHYRDAGKDIPLARDVFGLTDKQLLSISLVGKEGVACIRSAHRRMAREALGIAASSVSSGSPINDEERETLRRARVWLGGNFKDHPPRLDELVAIIDRLASRSSHSGSDTPEPCKFCGGTTRRNKYNEAACADTGCRGARCADCEWFKADHPGDGDGEACDPVSRDTQ